MAEYGEWNRKGATLSDVSAQKEYGVSRDFRTSKILRTGAAASARPCVWQVGSVGVGQTMLRLQTVITPRRVKVGPGELAITQALGVHRAIRIRSRDLAGQVKPTLRCTRFSEPVAPW